MHRANRSDRVRAIIGGCLLAGIIAALTVNVLGTPPSGLITTPIARSTIAQEFKVRARTDFLDVRIQSKGPVDVVVNRNRLLPGGTVGWHTHTGPVIVAVMNGSMTLYDDACNPTVVSAGEAFVEAITGDHAHTVRNEGVEDVEWTGTSFVPVGLPGRIDQPAPPNCPF